MGWDGDGMVMMMVKGGSGCVTCDDDCSCCDLQNNEDFGDESGLKMVFCVVVGG